jgi:ABC-type transporter Mla maintaining outer membrane lipid asymmetry ATPase subunit MlaF
MSYVQSNNYITIIGGAGSGKTATARHIALQLEKQGWEVVPVSELEQILQYGDRDHKQVFDRILSYRILSVIINKSLMLYCHLPYIISDRK